jgi:hypothetical protein
MGGGDSLRLLRIRVFSFEESEEFSDSADILRVVKVLI